MSLHKMIEPKIEVHTLDQVVGGWRAVISVPESRQHNLSLGVVCCHYHVFIPDKIVGIARGLLAGLQTDETSTGEASGADASR